LKVQPSHQDAWSRRRGPHTDLRLTHAIWPGCALQVVCVQNTRQTQHKQTRSK
jgi:hypothetical protein